jgi:Polyketide cyclase / dehydrase and lipid transport
MSRTPVAFAALLAALLAANATAQPAAPAPAPQAEYVRIEMSIDVARPAAAVWAKIGDYCAISEWFANPIDCTITSGDGGLGTVRALAGGRVIEILIAQTELSYGYTQPAVEGRRYDLYHGFLEARPVSANSSRILYTLVYDVSDTSRYADQAAKDADVARRRAMFEGALAKMKEIAEAQ